MNDRNISALRKILNHCKHIEDSRRRFGDSLDYFLSDFSYQNDCCMSILQIGELCKTLSMDFRTSYPYVPWRNWCGIRDIVAHKYEELDLEIAWDTIQNDVPFLKENVKKILTKNESESGSNDINETII